MIHVVAAHMMTDPVVIVEAAIAAMETEVVILAGVVAATWSR